LEVTGGRKKKSWGKSWQKEDQKSLKRPLIRDLKKKKRERKREDHLRETPLSSFRTTWSYRKKKLGKKVS